MADAFTKSNLNFRTKIQNEKQTYILNDLDLSYIQIIPTLSSTHFYITVFGSKKIRVGKNFYKFLNSGFHNNSVIQKETKRKELDTLFKDLPLT